MHALWYGVADLCIEICMGGSLKVGPFFIQKCVYYHFLCSRHMLHFLPGVLAVCMPGMLAHSYSSRMGDLGNST